MEETSGDYRPRYCPQFLFVVRNLSSTLSQYGTKDGGARSVPRVPTKVFGCNVISQTVRISLRRRPLVGGNGKLFVHCSERDLECSPKFCSLRGVYWSVSDFRRMGLTCHNPGIGRAGSDIRQAVPCQEAQD